MASTPNCESVTGTKNPKEPVIKFSYFPTEGFGECVRLALILSGTDFEDDRISYNDWFTTIKSTTPYGNLPIMTIDNGPMRTQSKAMLRWVGMTMSETLYPHDIVFDIEEAIGVVEDLMQAWRPVMWPFLYKTDKTHEYYRTEDGLKELQPIREKFLTNTLPIFMKYICDLIEKRGNGKWVASCNEPTIADCLLIPLLRSFTVGTYDFIPSSALDEYPTIVEYIKRFCALPQTIGRYNNGIH